MKVEEERKKTVLGDERRVFCLWDPKQVTDDDLEQGNETIPLMTSAIGITKPTELVYN